MKRTLAFIAAIGLPMMVTAATGAFAASPGYCTFTSPASTVCPPDAAPKQAGTAPKVQAVTVMSKLDHCIAISPASAACPAAAQAPQVASR